MYTDMVVVGGSGEGKKMTSRFKSSGENTVAYNENFAEIFLNFQTKTVIEKS